jgi:hypothetical protein
MRFLTILVLGFLLAGCADSSTGGGKSGLIGDRCADAGPEGSEEYKACKKKLAQEDAKRQYDLNNANQTLPGFLPPTSLPP